MGAAILSLAMSLMRVDEADKAIMQLFCTLAEAELRGRLRPGITAEKCPAFLLGAAWLALSQLAAAQEADGVKRFTAGDLTVEQGGARRSAALRRQAEETLADYLVDEGFCFRGVRG